MRSIAPAERINIDNDPVRNFDYDDESRITAVSGACTASCTCNGLRTRIEKTESAVTQTFMRDGVGVTSPVLNDGAAAYTPGTSERRSGVTTYMHSGIKNADLQSNTSEVVTAERTYDAFGNLTGPSGTWKGPFGYAGQFGYQEDGSGLKLLGHRYYDPSIGRFLTRDPIKDGTNWYAYCENNPVTAYDADGLQQEKYDNMIDRLAREGKITRGQAKRAKERERREKIHDEGRKRKRKQGLKAGDNLPDDEWVEVIDDFAPDGQDYSSKDIVGGRRPIVNTPTRIPAKTPTIPRKPAGPWPWPPVPAPSPEFIDFFKRFPDFIVHF